MAVDVSSRVRDQSVIRMSPKDSSSGVNCCAPVRGTSSLRCPLGAMIGMIHSSVVRVHVLRHPSSKMTKKRAILLLLVIFVWVYSALFRVIEMCGHNHS
ncbi:hypothetical protein JTE90_028859 [Oedothorax gibbosus]|uniref:Uncharacterized protein n=1 Tax=Oedothorax gibbosus TaxID=931172 RepID=A0AAV6U8L6_9ARAC|nr:hypothetical protein JTE90_028859 [Oedothorax gibbosus]